MIQHRQASSTKRIPLLEAQNGIVLSWMQHPRLTQHNIGFAHRFGKTVDVHRLHDAMLLTAERHDTFKTRIAHTEEGFCQYIDSSITFDVKVSTMADAEFVAYQRTFVRPFDMLNDVLIRMEIVETESAVYAMVDMAHCIADGYTMARFWDEVDATYQGKHPETDDHLELAIEREQASFGSAEYKEACQHCRQTLAGLEITQIPTTSPHAIGSIQELASVISQQQVDTFCRQQNLTPSMLFLIANAIALSAFCHESKIVIDALYHGRQDKDTAQTMGMFVKNIIVLFDFEQHASATVNELAAIIQQQFHIQHKGIYPFTHLARDLELNTSSNNTFSFQNWYKPVTINGETAETEYLKDGGTDDSTMLLIYPATDQYRVTVYYNDARYQEWLIRQYAESIVDIVLNIINHPEATISQLELLSPHRKETVLQQSEGEHLDGDFSFMDAFEQQVKLRPDSIAVADAHGTLTYARLDAAANTVSAYLQAHHLGHHDTIAIQMPRTKAYIAAVLGILKAGATFLPIDMEYPQSRKDYILHDAQAKLLITEDFMNDMLNGPQQSVFSKPADDPLATAYMIYTSGSTGNPKGVMISRRALDAFVRTCVHTYRLTANDRIFCHSNFSFDASIEDLFPILTCGGELHIPDEALRKDVAAIRQYIVDHHITGGNYTTAFGELLMDACPHLPLRYITLGGERLDKLPTNQTCCFFNSYGPTEFTVDATFWEMPAGYDGSSIPIGRPTCNCKAYVLDDHLRLLPNGCTGQLYLSGPQIATGYWHNEVMTREKFIANPYSIHQDDELMYATGDMVRWNADKQIEFVGRNDRQVKLRGFRIELGEIDVTLSHISGIIQSVTHIIPLNGHDVLCSWYTTSDGTPVKDIRSQASQSLPKFMVPDVFIHLEKFPLTPNGKIDYAALPAPQSEAARHQVIALSSNSERILMDIVSEITGTKDISVTDDLFDEIGLSSLQAIKLAFIAKSKGVDVNVTTLYERRTIRDIFRHTGKRNAHYWADGKYDPSKPVAILVCGYGYAHPHYVPFIDYFKHTYSIYILEAFHESFMWKEHISCDILMDEYMEAFHQDVEGKPLALIMGTCYGADLAIPFANRIKKDTGVAYFLLAMDPIYNRKDMVDDIPYEMNPDEAILEQYRISDILTKTLPTPVYDGPMIIVAPSCAPHRKYAEYGEFFFTEEEEQVMKRFLENNEADWKRYFPKVPYYKIPLDHYHFFDPENLSLIEKIIKKHGAQ